jgi:hypothetical protein
MYDVAYVGVRTNHIRLDTVWYAYANVYVCDIYIINIYMPRDMTLTLTLTMVEYDIQYRMVFIISFIFHLCRMIPS